MAETYRVEIVQRLTRNLLDIQLLRLIQSQPGIWGYRIKKTVETDLHVKIGHGVLYPTLNGLECRGFLASGKKRESGRARKIYMITEEGDAYLQTFYAVLREQADAKRV